MKVEVGILSAPSIEYCFPFDGHGDRRITARDPEISFPEQPSVIYDVVIGDDFHWERRMTQEFGGALKFIHEGDNVTAVNTIDLEQYLLSVISSEMRATADLEFLKAHAVISRSWVISMILSRRGQAACAGAGKAETGQVLPGRMEGGRGECVHGRDGAEGPANCGEGPADCAEDGTPQHLEWFGRSQHSLYDVCADDHCQRYQGSQMAVGENVREAVRATEGEVLSYGGNVCDARFSKCCGGLTERFGACWEDTDLPYLQPVEDPFCDTDDAEVLSKVLNDYDLETRDFHDWEVEYSAEALSELVFRRSGIDFGLITDLVPVERGASGRIVRLKIVGTARSMVVGKELLIRRYLSESHLKSSAFEVEKTGRGFILHGHGWGHGVGLCQIGAAVMAARGYGYREILAHYYPGAEIIRYEGQ